jgi:PKHD-type hydroxylase
MNLLQLRQQLGETPQTVALTGVYHNLLRLWATT